ncbi:PREDICTED: tubulin--tyrosine ligase-like protein 12 [Dufourea novaeangliae]|uniref:Tubulin--tyrosine ligase-like protein 12 n=1 Tax=Dufourea novaeangliae TaxID=178035 RepID=A0A154P4Z1_DUFNO|nr:PREDICTED: tubulin--tyrosine ligase-like protein 12 [Dufourea novaeangliae]KZC06258.1 Tubulin--tyrosine ligase-like protein 12 [Dufourea novaeangliae]
MDGVGLFNTFLQIHQPQLESSGVPRLFWEVLFKKLQYQTFDSGLAFQLIKIDYDDAPRGPKDPVWKLFVSAEKDISAQDPSNIYLIDHAWTFNTSSIRQNLSSIPGLLNRMCTLMGFDIEEEDNEKVEFIMNELWRYSQSFSLSSGSIEDRMPIWYIMDEVGSAINHSDDPNFRTVPFLYLPEGVTYTLLFPIKDVDCEEEITRDFVEGQTVDPKKRQALLLPWLDTSFFGESFIQKEPDENYFLAGHIRESLPENLSTQVLQKDRSSKLKVFSQYSYVNDYLNDPAFEIVDNEEQADILWYTSHFKEYKELRDRSPHIFVNQFPFEYVVTVKDLLSIVSRRKSGEKSYNPDTLETYPEWLPTTYNLSTELVEFVAYFEQRESMGLDNHWICKPWNLARGLDTHVTKNLFHILRLPSTGPKIAQKYIANPILYERPEIGKVKFDVRYVLLLKSVKPLRVFAYKNFFLRFANKEFALNNFDVYEQHFTVMNYSEDTPLCHLKCADFILEWERQYPEFSWSEQVDPKIMRMFREVFEGATAEEPPTGIADSPQSRAVYAVDLMLEWKKGDVQPVLLEINFSPDCKRACEYYPNFYNDVFRCLFLDENNPETVHDLCSGCD